MRRRRERAEHSAPAKILHASANPTDAGPPPAALQGAIDRPSYGSSYLCLPEPRGGRKALPFASVG